MSMQLFWELVLLNRRYKYSVRSSVLVLNTTILKKFLDTGWQVRYSIFFTETCVFIDFKKMTLLTACWLSSLLWCSLCFTTLATCYTLSAFAVSDSWFKATAVGNEFNTLILWLGLDLLRQKSFVANMSLRSIHLAQWCLLLIQKGHLTPHFLNEISNTGSLCGGITWSASLTYGWFA